MGIYWSWANGYVAWHSGPEQYLTVTKGYNMARNLQSKLPSSDTLLIQDINVDATKRFMEEAKATSAGATIRIANDVREASEDSVSICHVTHVPTLPTTCTLRDEFVLSMI
jgi:hypothetical protein